MAEMQNQEEIRLKWEQIKSNYDTAIKALKKAREGFEMHTLWELAENTKILEGTIILIEKLKRELPFPTPEIRGD